MIAGCGCEKLRLPVGFYCEHSSFALLAVHSSLDLPAVVLKAKQQSVMISELRRHSVDLPNLQL